MEINALEIGAATATVLTAETEGFLIMKYIMERLQKKRLIPKKHLRLENN